MSFQNTFAPSPTKGRCRLNPLTPLAGSPRASPQKQPRGRMSILNLSLVAAQGSASLGTSPSKTSTTLSVPGTSSFALDDSSPFVVQSSTNLRFLPVTEQDEYEEQRERHREFLESKRAQRTGKQTVYQDSLNLTPSNDHDSIDLDQDHHSPPPSVMDNLPLVDQCATPDFKKRPKIDPSTPNNQLRTPKKAPQTSKDLSFTPKKITNTPKKVPGTPRKRISDKRLLLVFQALETVGLTFGEFIKECIISSDEVIQSRLRMFYGHGGPAAVLRLWMDRFSNHARWDATLADVVIDYAGSRLRKETKKLITPKRNKKENVKGEEACKGTTNDTAAQPDQTKAIHVRTSITDGARRKRPVESDDDSDVESEDDPDEEQETNDNRLQQASVPKMIPVRLPASQLKRDQAMSFSFASLDQQIVIDAPRLRRLLTGLADKLPSNNKSGAEVKSDKDLLKERNHMQAVVGTITSMLMNRRSQKANYFQRIMGLYLHATGCSKRTVEMLSRAHICAAYDSTREAVAALTQDALDQVRLFARERDWFVVFDNVNIPNNRGDQRLGNLNTFDNGATGTIVEGKDLGKQENEPKDPYARFDLEDLVADGEKEMIAFRHYFVGVLHRHHPKFTPATVPPVEPIRLLETKKTAAYPLPAMKIDQSTVEGNLEITNLSSAILRTHYGTSRTPGSVGYNIDMLSRKRLAKDKPNFHDADEMLRQTFDAMVLRLWQNKLGTDLETIGTHLTETKPMQESIAAAVESLCEELCDVDSEIYQQTYGNANTSAMLFIRDMLVYIELCAAIKQGDIGRIEQVLKTITVMFQSVATKNYAIHTLRLSQEILCGWSETRKIAMLSSMLINTTGKDNSWIPSDLYQEHNNLLTKIRYAAGGSNRSWDYLDRSASMNIRLFGDIQDMVETAFSVPHNSKYHTTVDATKDIKTIIASLKSHHIFSNDGKRTPNDNDIIVSYDMYRSGFMNLHSGGRLSTFLESKNSRNILIADDNINPIGERSGGDVIIDNGDIAMEGADEEQDEEFDYSLFPIPIATASPNPEFSDVE